jgi:hypothetical protein
VSGETESAVSGWTTDTLHTHFLRQLDQLRRELDRQAEADRRAVELAFDAQRTAMSAALASAERAVLTALASQKEAIAVQAETLRQRADIQNEWRASLNDVLSRAMPRSEAEAALGRFIDRIQEISILLQHTATKAELDVAQQRATERIADLSTRVAQAEAQAQGAQGNKEAIMGVMRNWIAALGLLISIVVVLANLLT